MRFGAILFWLIVWHLVSLFVDHEILIVSPVKVFQRIMQLAKELKFWKITGLSLLRITYGFFLGVFVGSAFAVVTVKSKIFYNLFYPLISVIKSTPVTSFIIMAFFWFRRTENISPFIASLIVIPIIWGNVYEGIRNTDNNLLEMAKVMKVKRIKVLTKIYLPSVKPYLIAAFMASYGMAWKAGVAAEVITHPKFAMGTQMHNAQIYLETKDLLAWTVVAVLISVVIERVLVNLLRGRRGKR